MPLLQPGRVVELPTPPLAPPGVRVLVLDLTDQSGGHLGPVAEAIVAAAVRDRHRWVVAGSHGPYGLAVAQSAARRGIAATIVLPAAATRYRRAVERPKVQVLMAEGTYPGEAGDGDPVAVSRRHVLEAGGADVNLTGPYAPIADWVLAERCHTALAELTAHLQSVAAPVAVWVPLADGATTVAVAASLQRLGWPTTLMPVTAHRNNSVHTSWPGRVHTPLPVGAGTVITEHNAGLARRDAARGDQVLDIVRRRGGQVVGVNNAQLIHGAKHVAGAGHAATTAGAAGVAGLLATARHLTPGVHVAVLTDRPLPAGAAPNPPAGPAASRAASSAGGPEPMPRTGRAGRGRSPHGAAGSAGTAGRHPDSGGAAMTNREQGSAAPGPRWQAPSTSARIRTAALHDAAVAGDALATAFADTPLTALLPPSNRSTRRRLLRTVFTGLAAEAAVHGVVDLCNDGGGASIWLPADITGTTATTADTAALERALDRAMEELRDLAGAPHSVQRSFAALLGQPGQVAGSAVMPPAAAERPRGSDRPQAAFLIALGVDPDARSSGAAQELLTHRHGMLDRHGIPAVAVAIDRAGHQRYTTAGYRPHHVNSVTDGLTVQWLVRDPQAAAEPSTAAEAAGGTRLAAERARRWTA